MSISDLQEAAIKHSPANSFNAAGHALERAAKSLLDLLQGMARLLGSLLVFAGEFICTVIGGAGTFLLWAGELGRGK